MSEPYTTQEREDAIDFVLARMIPRVDAEDIRDLNHAIERGTAFEQAVIELQQLDEIDEQEREAHADRLRKALAEFGHLRGLDDDELRQLHSSELEKVRVALEKTEKARAEVELSNDQHEWSNIAEQWRKRRRWLAREAVALTLRKNPGAVRPAGRREWNMSFEFEREYKARLDLVERAIRENHLKTPIERTKFLEWARVNKIEFPSELNLQGKPSESFRQSEASEAEDPIGSDDINPRTLQALYRMLLGMAVRKYDFDPNYGKIGGEESSTFGDIEKDLKLINITLNRRTIREHLKAAAKVARDANLNVLMKPSRKT